MEVLATPGRAASDGGGGPRCEGIWRAILAIGLFAAGGLYPVPSVAASLEIAVKATFLYKFASFIEWPGTTLGPTRQSFNICTVGEDPFDGSLDDAIGGEHILGHPVALRHLASAGPNSGCEIMFIGGSSAQSVAAALAAVRGSPVLTVTDRSRIDGPPGIINFVVRDNHVRFEIDREAAARNGIEISSKLLSLAVPAEPRE